MLGRHDRLGLWAACALTRGPDRPYHWTVATLPESIQARWRRAVVQLRANIQRAVKVRDEVLRDVPVALLAEGHALIEDYPGVGNTVLAEPPPAPGRRTCPRPMHGGPAARGRDRHQRLQSARGAIRVPSRASVRERRAGRRGQPHFPQDPVGPAGVHAGAARDRRRPGARAGAAVPRHRDPEPHRVRGDLSPSRGSAGPVHGANRPGIPGGRRGSRDARRPRGPRPGDGPRAGCGRRDRARRAGGGDRRPWLRGVAAICRSALRRDPAGRAGRAGRKPSSGVAPLPGRQGPERRSRGAITRSRTTSRRWPPPSSNIGCCSPLVRSRRTGAPSSPTRSSRFRRFRKRWSAPGATLVLAAAFVLAGAAFDSPSMYVPGVALALLAGGARLWVGAGRDASGWSPSRGPGRSKRTRPTRSSW